VLDAVNLRVEARTDASHDLLDAAAKDDAGLAEVFPQALELSQLITAFLQVVRVVGGSALRTFWLGARGRGEGLEGRLGWFDWRWSRLRDFGGDSRLRRKVDGLGWELWSYRASDLFRLERPGLDDHGFHRRGIGRRGTRTLRFKETISATAQWRRRHLGLIRVDEGEGRALRASLEARRGRRR